MSDFQAFSEQVLRRVRDYCARAVAPTLKRLDEVERVVREIPIPKDGRDVDMAEVGQRIEAGIKAAVAQIPMPRDGKDADPALIKQLVAAAVAELPPAEPGKDADEGAVTRAVLETVLLELEKIPVPKDGIDGKNPDPELLRLMIREEVSRQVAEIPKPADGKSVDMVELAGMISAAAAQAASALPRPADGKDVTPEQVREAVERAVADWPRPRDGENGKSVDQAVVKAMIDEAVLAAVAALPKARDGRDADQQQILEVLRAEIKQIIDAFPRPRDAREVDPNELRELIEQSVAKLPPPKDGRDADPVVVAQLVTEGVKQLAALLQPPAVEDGTIRSLVAEELAKLPVPEDRREVDPSALLAFVAAEVSRQVGALPKPVDGRDASPEAIREEVQRQLAEWPRQTDIDDGARVDADAVRAMVEVAVGAIPKPKDGADADPARVREMVEEAVANIPRPRDGKDVDPLTLHAEVSRQVAEAVAALPKPRDGKDAEPIHPDTLALLVQRAVDTAVSKIKPAEPGRDALEIDVGDGLQDDKSYPRGKFAAYRGGMVRAVRATDPLSDGKSLQESGWLVILNGIADMEEISEDGGRFLVRKTTYTTGKVVTVRHKTHCAIDRGVYDGDKKYLIGDEVTWGGNKWHSNVDEPTKRPGDPGSTEWRLSVKRGRDGKDGKDGTDGNDGKDGRNWNEKA